MRILRRIIALRHARQLQIQLFMNKMGQHGFVFRSEPQLDAAILDMFAGYCSPLAASYGLHPYKQEKRPQSHPFLPARK
jgi:hypothetical protein